MSTSNARSDMTSDLTPEARYGRLLDPRTLRIERTLDAPRDQVWSFVVDPARRARWLAGGDQAASPGQTIELAFDNDRLSDQGPSSRFAEFGGRHCMSSRVIAIEPPHRLVITWMEGSPRASEVSFELTALGDRTRLVLVHRLLPDRQGLVMVASGWHTHLDLLEDLLAGRAPRAFWKNFDAQHDAYQQRIPPA